ncbi:MAG: membrane protein insertion efficiency factor YidD [Bacteroidales bacterium]|jgi:putative component of membrane protein insertase Oxa1/YidC/SpoIIIJ protein YidD
MKVIILSITLFCFIHISYSQNLASDIKLIGEKNYSIKAGDNNSKSNKTVNNKAPIDYKHKSFIAKYNPFSLLATSAMLFYQNVVSQQFFRHCLYERSCSNFSKQAINEFGLIKGIFMSADRLMRCNGTAINDVPPDLFDDEQLAIDEPSKYHWKKR